MMVRSLALALGAVAVLSAPAEAAPAKKTVPKKRAAAPAPKPLSPVEVLARQLSLNRYVTGESIGGACRQTSYKGLAVALNMNRGMLTSAKGEYETSAQFDERSAKLANIMGGEPIVFCEALDDNEDIGFNYKADDQLFEGSFFKNHNVWRDVKQLGTYRSKTRMGIPVTVKSSAEFEYDVALEIPSPLIGCVSGEYGSYKFQVPQALAGAPALKVGGKIAIIAKLVPPYVSEEESPGEPSLDNPYDIYTHTITLHAKPEKLVVIDGAGKEVWSCRVGALAPLQKPRPIGDEKRWLSLIDYPTSGYRTGAAGTVSATLHVNPEGKVTDCAVTGTSGYPELDASSCSGWSKRGSFVPASDAEGNAIAGDYAITRTWTR